MKLASMGINLRSQALSLNLPSGLLWGQSPNPQDGNIQKPASSGSTRGGQDVGERSYLDKPHLLRVLDVKSKMETGDSREHHSFSSSSSCNPGWR